MVFVDSLARFVEEAERLLHSDTKKTRCCFKIKPNEGQVVLKATNDHVCIKYKTSNMNDLDALAKTNASLFTIMTGGPAPVVVEDIKAQNAEMDRTKSRADSAAQPSSQQQQKQKEKGAQAKQQKQTGQQPQQPQRQQQQQQHPQKKGGGGGGGKGKRGK